MSGQWAIPIPRSLPGLTNNDGVGLPWSERMYWCLVTVEQGNIFQTPGGSLLLD